VPLIEDMRSYGRHWLGAPRSASEKAPAAA
jgi:hypothetical protein